MALGSSHKMTACRRSGQVATSIVQKLGNKWTLVRPSRFSVSFSLSFRSISPRPTIITVATGTGPRPRNILRVRGWIPGGPRCAGAEVASGENQSQILTSFSEVAERPQQVVPCPCPCPSWLPRHHWSSPGGTTQVMTGATLGGLAAGIIWPAQVCGRPAAATAAAASLSAPG